MGSKNERVDFDLNPPPGETVSSDLNSPTGGTVSSGLEEEDIASQALSRLPSLVTPEPITVCKCLTSAESSVGEIVSERKKHILSAVSRVETYLRERRIPELVRFLLTKIMQRDIKYSNVVAYTATLLDDCMMFRKGVGVAPVLFEERHLQAVIKSFDPGQRGWMTAGQVRRAYITIGLNPPAKEQLQERNPTDVVLQNMRVTQEQELYDLLIAGVPEFENKEDDSSQSQPN